MGTFVCLALLAAFLGLVGACVREALGVGEDRGSAALDREPPLERAFLAFATGLAFVSLLILVLAVLGIFSLWAVLGVSAIPIAAQAWRVRSDLREFRDGLVRDLPGLGAICATVLAVWALIPAYESKLNASDASLYLAMAAHVAQSGAIAASDPLVAQMTPAERQALFENRFRGDATGRYARFPGGVQLADVTTATVSFHFQHLWPVWLALGREFIGDPGLVSVLSLFAGAGLIALFLVARRLAGPAFGVTAAALLLASFPQLLYSRLPLSEVPAQALFLAGLFAFLRAVERSPVPDRGLQVLAASLWGCFCLMRVDGIIFLLPALVLAFFLESLRRSLRDWQPFVGTLFFFVGFAALQVAAGGSYQKALADLPLIGAMLGPLGEWLRQHQAAVVIAWVCAGIAAAVASTRSPKWSSAITILAYTASIAVSLAWLIGFAPSLELAGLLHHADWLALYLPGLAFPAVIAGLAMAIVSAVRAPRAQIAERFLLIVLLVPLTSLLIQPMVTPTHPWAIRRFVPMAFPLLMLVALLGWRDMVAALARRFDMRVGYGYAIPAVIAFIGVLPQSGFLWRETLYAGSTEQILRLAKKIPSDAVVLIADEDAGMHMQVALQYGADRATLLVPSGAVTPKAEQAIAGYIERQLAGGRRVVVLDQARDGSNAFAARFRMRPLFSEEVDFLEIPQSVELKVPRGGARRQVAYRGAELLPPGHTARDDESSKEMIGKLREGFDLSRPQLPEFVTGIAGISHAEPTGRWTDGPVATLRFAHPLPPRVVVELDIGDVFAANVGAPLAVRYGDDVQHAVVPKGYMTLRVPLASSRPADAIEIRPAHPTAPSSLGKPGDNRLLGVRLKAVRIAADASASPSQASGGDVLAALSGGLDFSRPELPAVARMQGVSHAEPWGRWTDGPVARIEFTSPLPARFTLELLVAHVFGPNRGVPIRVRAGSAERSFVVSKDDELVRVDLSSSAPSSTLEFRIPHPTSPGPADTRRLGIRLKVLRVAPLP